MKRRKRGLRGQAEQQELELYIDNEEPLYRQKMAIHKSLDAKVKSGRFDKTKAPKAFSHVVDAGARKYAKEFGGSVRTMFPKSDRDAVAREYTKEYMSERGLKGLKGRGVRGLGWTKEEHLSEGAKAVERFDTALDQFKRSKNCASATRHFAVAQRHFSTVAAHADSARAYRNSRGSLHSSLFLLVPDLYKDLDRAEKKLISGCLLDTPRNSLEGIRRKRKATKRKARR